MLIVFFILAAALIVFLVIRNQKDEKVFEKDLNDEYDKVYEEKNEEKDIETEQQMH